ncbi:MAG: hypothetical protein R3335_01910 [Anaerolineales bacterium]|nr:hypothetical protein [Anaerolineales bacterium]
MYRYIVLLHILSGFFFMMAHGASAAVAFRLRYERHHEKMRALLELTSSMARVMWIMLLLILVTGIIAGVMGRWWLQGWFWTSLVLLILITVFMGFLSGRTYYPLKDALGLYAPFDKVTEEEIEAKLNEPIDDDKVQELAASGRPWEMTLVSLIGWSIIVWLMLFKPF